MGCEGCSGACCTVFQFSVTPERLRTREPHGPDDAFLADMLIELTPEEAERRIEALPDCTYKAYVPGVPYYTCRHFVEDTGDCSMYPVRPRMCREYPYDHECHHGCDYTAPEDVQKQYKELRVRQDQARNA